MSCVHNNFNDNCQMFDPNIEMPGCDENGNCLCDTDEDPTVMCEYFEPVEGWDDYET